jgi:thiol-disulfide isomerase/thioredoxin
MTKQFANKARRAVVLAGVILGMLASAARADSTNAGPANAAADKAWNELQQVMMPPPTPAEWAGKEPTPEQADKFRAAQGRLAGEAADQAKDFYTRFSSDARAFDARRAEWKLVETASRLGNTNRVARLEELEETRLKEPGVSEDERFAIRSRAIERAALSRQKEGMAAVIESYEKGVRELQKEFPKRPELYNMLLTVAENSPRERALALAKEIVAGTANPQLQMLAELFTRRTVALDRPLELKVKAVDGREVDIAKVKGKVVLLDFWATRCPPCVALTPTLKALYEKYQPKGFEIIGINSDEQKAQMTRFLAQEKVTWLQYFDSGEALVGSRLGIYQIPALWLVDKQGVVRDNRGVYDLEAKIQKLLAE